MSAGSSPFQRAAAWRLTGRRLSVPSRRARPRAIAWDVTKRTLLAWIVATAPSMTAHADDVDTQPAARALRAAASQLVAATPEPQRSDLSRPFTDEARSDWHYTPRIRAGVPWKRMNARQLGAARSLLSAALSTQGHQKVRAVFALEIALRELEGSSIRDPENYAFAIFGEPAPGSTWGFRLEGHHLSLHFTIDRDRVVSSLPQFIGANPAESPRDFANGPRAGQRALRDEEDRAFALLAALTPEQRKAAIIDARPYGDILTRNARKVSALAPAGVRFSQLERAQQVLLLRIIDAFGSLVEPSLAEQRLTRVRAGGLDSIRFAWAGAQKRGQPYYYRIQGAEFLIELDNSGGNHIHTIWRDFSGDWGRDVLGEHYRNAAGSTHQH
jgi:hypothetical protein